MVAIKNRIACGTILVPLLALLLAGCTPAGPRALLDGQKLLAAGRPREALQKLTLATQLLATNAQAWNYLGLARHQSGDRPGAVQAYQQALRLNRDLFEAHFNLGCLWLDQSKPELARNEFTACTMRRPNALEAWLKLGAAHLRLGELSSAEEAFQKSLRLAPSHPEALNGLGLVSAQRRRPREAVQHFITALKPQPPYRPALLNLATVLHRDLNDPAGATQRYREYLTLQPREADWDAVNALLQTIERRQTAALQTTVTSSPPPATSVASNLARSTAPAPTPVALRTNAPVATAAPPAAPATNSLAAATQPSPPRTNPAMPAPPTLPPPAAPIVSPSTGNKAPVANASVPAEKRGLLARLNPFRGESKPVPKVTILPSTTNGTDGVGSAADLKTVATPASASSPRYAYLLPTVPSTGDSAAAAAAIARGRSAHAANRLTEAAQAFQSAVDADAASFDGRYHLGLTQYALRDYQAALATWEVALAIRPDSTDARYSFAITLKAAGYPLDAAAELEKLLTAAPNEVRAHLVLGNLYAEQLQDRGRARVHYQRVLELDSRHPQATQIRYWLVANPV